MPLETQITKQLVSLLKQLGDQGQVSFQLNEQTQGALTMIVSQILTIEGREEVKSWQFNVSLRSISLIAVPDHLVADGLEAAKRVFNNIV